MTKGEEKIGLRGDITLTLRDKYGRIKDQRKIRNLIVDSGYDFVCDVMGNSTQPADMGYIAIGQGTTAFTAGDTALYNESTRKANSYSHTAGTKTYESVSTFNAGEGTGSITESGLFNDSTAGTMLCAQTFSVINKGANDSLEVTWRITLS